MGGINGCVIKQGCGNSLSLLKIMNQKIRHRGSDNMEVFYQDHRLISVGMGVRYLSFSSPKAKDKTFKVDEENMAIVLDGAIYNKSEIYKVLGRSVVEFTSISDAELVLKLYKKYGVVAFNMLEGMYAFSIYDKNQNKVFVVRDFFGGKPLYYYHSKEKFYWASELKSIAAIFDRKPEINKLAVNLFFQLTYIPSPYTIYENVHKLEPDQFIEYDLIHLSCEIKSIKRSPIKINSDLKDKRKTKKIVHDKVMNSVASRITKDVSMGALLSGGVDSAIISLCMAKQSGQKIDTFSIGFKKKSFDETNKSRIVANLIDSNHHEFIIGEEDLYDHLDDVILNFDEPFADSSALPSYLVAKKAKNRVAIALTGDGGDEVFGGYNKYYMGRLNQAYTAAIPKAVHKLIKNTTNFVFYTRDDNRGYRFKLKRLMNAMDYQGQFYYGIVSLGFSEYELYSILTNNYFIANPLKDYKNRIPHPKTIRDFRAVDRMLSLEGDMLVKADRTSMLSSIESRAPFLNRELWEIANQIPQDFLIKGWDKKHILKEAFKHYFPKGFLDQPKRGFGVPVGDWLRGSLRSELEEYIDEAFLIKQGIFNIEVIRKIVSDHLVGKVDNTFRVWTFYCFQKWYMSIYN